MTETAQVSLRDEIHLALREEMERDPKLILMGEDICEYGGAFAVTGDLHERFPGRVINTPISENSFVGAAVGAAMSGMRVVVELMFMDFVTLAMDQIVNHAAKIFYMYAGQVSVPIVIRMPYGGYRGYGPSHSQTLASWFLSVPGLKVVVPAGASHGRALLKAAIRDPNPVIFLEHKLLYGQRTDLARVDREVPPLGRARLVKQGTDVSIITYGLGVRLALQAQEKLTTEGISAEVVDLVTLKPYDAETVFASVRKTGKAVFLEEGVKMGGVGAELCAAVAENCLWDLDGRLVRVGARDVPIPAATNAEAMVLPGAADVVAAVRSACEA
jgi:pyruvate/2-oxoglutarate/acetoin dehydrogenase E1 component